MAPKKNIVCLVRDAPDLDSNSLTFRFELIRSIGSITLSKSSNNFHKGSRLRQYLYHCALKSSVVLLERECDDLMGKNIAFYDELDKYAVKTVMYRICVDYDIVDPAKNGYSFKVGLTRIIMSFGGRLKGYLRLSNDFNADNVKYVVFHLVLQTKNLDDIKSFDIALKQLLQGHKINELLTHGTKSDDSKVDPKAKREYSKYIFAEGILFKGFDCLLPRDGLLNGKMVALLYGNKDEFKYEPKLGINCVPFSSRLYNNEFETASSTTAILIGDFLDVLADWSFIKDFHTHEHRVFEEPDIEKMYYQRHETLKTQARDNFFSVGSINVDENKESKESKESKVDDIGGLDDDNGTSNDKNDTKGDKVVKKIMLVGESYQQTDFIVAEQVYRSHFQNVKVVQTASSNGKNNSGKPQITATVTKIPFGKECDNKILRLIYLLLIGQHKEEIKNAHPVLLANCFVILDREGATKLKQIIVDEFAWRIANNKFFE